MVIDSALALWKGGSLLHLKKFMRTNDPASDTRPNRKMFPIPATLVIRPPLPPLDESTINIDETPNAHPPAWRLSGDPSHLRRCNKIMIFRFSDNLGWGAGLLFIARLHLIAARVGAVLLVDNGRWWYGRLEYYFQPYKINCVPPDDWYDDKRGQNISSEGWETAERIIANWDQLAAVDAYEDKIARADLDVEGMQRLNDLEFGPGRRPSVLPAPETLPLPMVPAFEAQATVLRQYWKPLPQTLEQVQEVKEMMGIGGPQPTVGVMIRLGDKGWEYRHSLRPSNVHNTLSVNRSFGDEVMHNLYDRMIPTSLATNTSQPWYPLSSSARLFTPAQQPIAIVVTAEETALLNISLESTAAPFRFDRTPSLKLAAGTYRKNTFAKWPMKTRVAHTRQLVRDIEIMAKYTDATVVTMSSNIGRIVTMQAALGPTDAQGNHVGGRM
ncbi:BZ3500_MvSof-1268-A1-R1_Chr1-1g00884 [Microbotryum saponariae]|uniref:BZ3500_MvSof-1268-A1-R1_Chr1-1g00884 protein n=1 Tax=Microbotryum saponariae TaxID=289078 RepID=A0A2X0LAP0_9BASI|nr:BZ3500_MvSof-1268-A1-R1_Chr1-1g00884 [Microbotryum saponariae]SCZ92853.1 BZ3501_MvSof-1269-A2-R1_Chr1-1g00481 [Microbotryum saponariae]